MSRGLRGFRVVARLISASTLVLAGPVWAQEVSEALSPETQELIAQLEEKDAYTRQMAFMRLEALRDPATAPIIRRYLDSKNADTRAFSVRALAAIERTSAIPTLVERLQKDKNPHVRVAALLALEPFQDPAVLPALLGRLRDRNPQVRMAAVDAVSRVDHPQAREAILKRWRRERHRDVRRVLQDAVNRPGTP